MKFALSSTIFWIIYVRQLKGGKAKFKLLFHVNENAFIARALLSGTYEQ